MNKEQPRSQNVIVKVKNVFGNDLIYPVNIQALRFAALLNKKTFSESQLRVINQIHPDINIEWYAQEVKI
tara:strand:- start:240 stop:449 length:210 start_codon:yes stop_codon:yes gene_type:complete